MLNNPRPGRFIKRKMVWGVLWSVMLLIGVLPLYGQLPAPPVPAITHAVHVGPDDRLTPVELPSVRRERGATTHYRLSIQIESSERPLYLFIPFLSQRAAVYMDGRLIADSGNRGVMQGLASGTTLLAMLPEDLLAAGSRALDVHLRTTELVPSYLAPLYVGTAEQLGPYYRLSVFLFEHLLVMALAGQLLMGLSVLIVWLYRPREPLFGWLTSMLFLSMFIYAGMFGDFQARWSNLMPYAIMLGSSASLILVIVTMLISGWSPPRWLKLAAAGVPLICILATLSAVVPPLEAVFLFNAPLNVLSLVASAAIVCRAAATHGSQDARLLLLPLCLLGLVVMHDFFVVQGMRDKPLFLSLYYRPLLMLGIAMILMRRLGTSLTRLDDANDHLRRTLEQREAELARLHEEDRRNAAVQVRQAERQRLTVDLHDGLSGHLASIIALSEREQSSAIELSAREALDDLRLVIHSLDIDDRELGVALSGLRERLERQLRRLGIELDWSTANLPEISGVTPTHALNVLRIVQEALTNAVTHGQARRIRVHGSPSTDGRACLCIENDGVPFSPNLGGYGLHNMQRRVGQLGGQLSIESVCRGTRLCLLLPLQLPIVPNQPALMAAPQGVTQRAASTHEQVTRRKAAAVELPTCRAAVK